MGLSRGVEALFLTDVIFLHELVLTIDQGLLLVPDGTQLDFIGLFLPAPRSLALDVLNSSIYPPVISLIIEVGLEDILGLESLVVGLLRHSVDVALEVALHLEFLLSPQLFIFGLVIVLDGVAEVVVVQLYFPVLSLHLAFFFGEVQGQFVVDDRHSASKGSPSSATFLLKCKAIIEQHPAPLAHLALHTPHHVH